MLYSCLRHTFVIAMHVKDHKSQLETHLKPIFFLFLLHNTIDKILYVTFWLQKKIVLGYCSLDIFIDTNQFKLQQMFLLFFFYYYHTSAFIFYLTLIILFTRSTVFLFSLMGQYYLYHNSRISLSDSH